MRKLMRSMARAAMKQAGCVQIHKSAWFARHWREWINGAPTKKKKKKRR